MPAAFRIRLVTTTALALASAAASPGADTAADTAADSGQGDAARPLYRSPNVICVSPDGWSAAVVNQSSDTVSIVDIKARRVAAEIAVGSRPTDAAFAPGGKTLYVACHHGGTVDVLDLDRRSVTRRLQAGDEPYGLAIAPDGKSLYVANSLADTVSIIDVESGRARAEVPVGRRPYFVAMAAGGKHLVVANALGRSLTIIDLDRQLAVETRDLGRASLLRQIACSRDGRWIFVANILSHDETLPVQMERGWIHSNGFTVADLTRPGHRVTLLLDRLLAGAANPWGVAFSPDESRLYVTLAGVHELAIVDLPRAMEVVRATTPAQVKALEENVEILESAGIARRVGAGGLGPRGLAFSTATGELLVANYFSDTISVLDAESGDVRAVIPLGPPQEMTVWRRGELLFNDARITYQTWFSCASCHQEDATIDALNWDLPNDGLGNSKNVKSMFDAHDTPPAMWSGVRTDMDAAVAAGQRFLGFLPDPENHRALMTYLANLERPPNPLRGRHPASEARGRSVFLKAGCDTCHPAPSYTDRQPHDVGLGTPDDYRSRFDTPSLRDCLRTAPYLHDGRARTLRDIFIEHNPHNFHGRTRGLTEKELDDLVTYLKTL